MEFIAAPSTVLSARRLEYDRLVNFVVDRIPK